MMAQLEHKKCMDYRAEGRRPVGRPRKPWLESVEADMAELEIDKEDGGSKALGLLVVKLSGDTQSPANRDQLLSL